MMADQRPVTALLLRWRAGDDDALDRLMGEVYGELRGIAVGQMRGERPGHTLQPTAVVNEAVLRLLDADVAWQDRAHFLAVAARAMRRVLVDYARGRRRLKRGGDAMEVTLNDALAPTSERPADVTALDDALTQFARTDPRRAELLELYYFGGLTLDQLAEVVGRSKSSVHRDLRVATAWVVRALGATDSEG